MKKKLVEKYEFEKGDLFFVVADKKGSTYRKGDFILLKEPGMTGGYFYVTNPRTLDGLTSCATFTCGGLEELLLSGVIEYQGNVKA